MANQRNEQMNHRKGKGRQVGEESGEGGGCCMRHSVSLSPKINVLNDINSGPLSIQLGGSERYNYCPMWLHCLQRA